MGSKNRNSHLTSIKYLELSYITKSKIEMILKKHTMKDKLKFAILSWKAAYIISYADSLQ